MAITSNLSSVSSAERGRTAVRARWCRHEFFLLGDTAPDFRSNTQNGPFAFHDWLDGSWAVLFSHPKDFTPVCSTEIARAARLAGEFRKRRTKIATLSAGTAESHRQWAAELSDAFGVAIDFPLIVDDDRLTIARQYGMVHPKLSDITTIRSVFVIDPNKTIRLILTYPHTTGRNFDEILRVLDSLQTADRHSIVTRRIGHRVNECSFRSSCPTTTRHRSSARSKRSFLPAHRSAGELRSTGVAHPYRSIHDPRK